jgi:uncharacterized damage-inducible protein DinB
MTFKSILCGLTLSAAAFAQTAPSNPLVAGSQVIYGGAKANILKSADMVPEAMWSYRPAPTVRTFGELFAHIADGQYEFCSPVAEGTVVDKGIEKARKSRTETIAALKEGFAYCDAAYTKITAANATDLVDFNGRKMPKISLMDFNAAHNMEHYGNVVTYLRMNKLVPPSSKK